MIESAFDDDEDEDDLTAEYQMEQSFVQLGLGNASAPTMRITAPRAIIDDDEEDGLPHKRASPPAMHLQGGSSLGYQLNPPPVRHPIPQ